ncbi:hypothetical protein GQ44DRAFT_727335 [Phaeosphaeriaceae sp. PMI808]|nr:hypothetical protein GQ44DRAFT_727335 [Phaeosphaeriaceae sp. PMI808]
MIPDCIIHYPAMAMVHSVAALPDAFTLNQLIVLLSLLFGVLYYVSSKLLDRRFIDGCKTLSEGFVSVVEMLQCIFIIVHKLPVQLAKADVQQQVLGGQMGVLIEATADIKAKLADNAMSSTNVVQAPNPAPTQDNPALPTIMKSLTGMRTSIDHIANDIKERPNAPVPNPTLGITAIQPFMTAIDSIQQSINGISNQEDSFASTLGRVLGALGEFQIRLDALTSAVDANSVTASPSPAEIMSSLTGLQKSINIMSNNIKDSSPDVALASIMKSLDPLKVDVNRMACTPHLGAPAMQHFNDNFFAIKYKIDKLPIGDLQNSVHALEKSVKDIISVQSSTSTPFPGVDAIQMLLGAIESLKKDIGDEMRAEIQQSAIAAIQSTEAKSTEQTTQVINVVRQLQQRIDAMEQRMATPVAPISEISLAIEDKNMAHLRQVTGTVQRLEDRIDAKFDLLTQTLSALASRPASSNQTPTISAPVPALARLSMSEISPIATLPTPSTQTKLSLSPINTHSIVPISPITKIAAADDTAVTVTSQTKTGPSTVEDQGPKVTSPAATGLGVTEGATAKVMSPIVAGLGRFKGTAKKVAVPSLAALGIAVSKITSSIEAGPRIPVPELNDKPTAARRSPSPSPMSSARSSSPPSPILRSEPAPTGFHSKLIDGLDAARKSNFAPASLQESSTVERNCTICNKQVTVGFSPKVGKPTEKFLHWEVHGKECHGYCNRCNKAIPISFYPGTMKVDYREHNEMCPASQGDGQGKGRTPRRRNKGKNLPPVEPMEYISSGWSTSWQTGKPKASVQAADEEAAVPPAEPVEIETEGPKPAPCIVQLMMPGDKLPTGGMQNSKWAK